MEGENIKKAYLLLKLSLLEFFNQNPDQEYTSSMLSKSFNLVTKNPRGKGQNRLSLELLETLATDGFIIEKTELHESGGVKRRLYKYYDKKIPTGWTRYTPPPCI